MVKTLRQLILLTCFTTGIATILSLVSLSTQQWIVSNAVLTDINFPSEQESNVKYGLFGGIFKNVIGGQGIVFEIQTTCLVADNICAMLCGFSEEDRRKELTALKNGDDVEFNRNCPQIKKGFKPIEYGIGRSRAPENASFINAGSLISTALFLSIASLFGLISCFLAIWNTGGNPIQTVFSVKAMCIYNSISAVTILVAICVWGIEYTMNLIDNVGIFYTIVGSITTKNRAQLGFSYWITIPALFLYITSVFILYSRDYRIRRQPIEVVEMDDNNDNLILY